MPSQQPPGQDVASHTQAPAWHIWPAPQAGELPQVQAPRREQPSARTASQPPHRSPPVPQVPGLGALQVAPEQHPFGQVALVQPLHRPPVQVSPVGQVSQALPPVPHDVVASPERQAPPEQHPFGHEVLSHTQVLPRQRWPRGHAAPIPQRQAPVEEQLSERASQAAQVAPADPQVATDRVVQVAPSQHPPGHDVSSQVQIPPAQTCPGAHAGPAPHTQAPATEHALVVFGSHVVHTPPAVPHAARLCAMHTWPAQHPAGQLDASHVAATFSSWHVDEHPSSDLSLPSSQVSMGARTT